MEVWVLITITAAFLQNIRSSMQKHLKNVMGTTGATFVRFGFGVPFAALIVVVLVSMGRPLPTLNAEFMAWVMLGGATQIAAQFLLVHLFSFRNFAVGTAYSRTEPAQAALFGLLFLGERVTAWALIPICISVVGVMLISVARTPFRWQALITSVGSRTALIGLLSGMLFGIAAVSYRGASQALAPSLPAPDFMMQASVTLLTVIILQTVAMFTWMIVRDRAELGRVAKAWRPSLIVGFAGATASFGWFMAMTLEQAAYVKAVAQVEMLFTFASSVLIFRERINRLELAGCVFIVLGVVWLAIGL